MRYAAQLDRLTAQVERAYSPSLDYVDAPAISRQAGLEPDAWQEAVLRSSAPRMLLNCCRQSGKSTTVATLAAHLALYHAGALILLLSPGERQSKELFRKCIDLYRALGKPVPADSETKLELELVNGSRIVALPGNETTVRSYSGVDLLLIDEAARVDDDLYRACKPMLAVSGGRLIALSTPWGKRGWWHNAWSDGGATWQRVKITAEECPRISPAFLAEERRTLPARWYNQEYNCLFEDTDDAVFSHASIRAALSTDVTPLFSGRAA